MSILRMPITFEILATNNFPLWDYGWFDLTEFRIGGDINTLTDPRMVLDSFLKHPIAQRSYCTNPDPWGVPIGRRGPFLAEQASTSWYRQVSSDKLEGDAKAALYNASFRPRPSAEQQGPVDDWLKNARDQDLINFVLYPPDSVSARVDYAWIWLVYHEYICLSKDLRYLTIAVIGFE